MLNLKIRLGSRRLDAEHNNDKRGYQANKYPIHIVTVLLNATIVKKGSLAVLVRLKRNLQFLRLLTKNVLHCTF